MVAAEKVKRYEICPLWLHTHILNITDILNILIAP